MLAMPAISSSAPGDDKNGAENTQHVRIKSEVNFFPNLIHSCNGTCRATNIQHSVSSGFLWYHLKLWQEVLVFYVRELLWKC